jgi:hypothetical protein
MKANLFAMIGCAALALSACSRDDANTEGNGPGDADGLGGRTDPQTRQNDPAARDAAPGPMSETSPPSTDEEGREQSPPQ